ADGCGTGTGACAGSLAPAGCVLSAGEAVPTWAQAFAAMACAAMTADRATASGGNMRTPGRIRGSCQRVGVRRTGSQVACDGAPKEVPITTSVHHRACNLCEAICGVELR